MPPLVNKDNTKIIVCCHKECTLPDDTTLLPIEVGASLHHSRLRMQADDRVGDEACENISEKNLSFCEMTAVYWAWKHLRKVCPSIEYVGINHYRRYFDFGRVLPMQLDIVVSEEELQQYRVDVQRLGRILRKKDVIVARPLHCDTSVFNQYSSRHVSDDMRTAIEVVHRLSPSFDEAMYEVIVRGNTFSPFNMGVLRWELFDDYCAWVFPILFEIERRIDIRAYSDLQKRVFGYLAERLWNVFIRQRGLAAEGLPILTTAGTAGRGAFRCAVTAARKDVGYRLSRRSGQWDRQEFNRITRMS